MGQYKGALNPQAHGQNSFECERTFHGGDNVIIETFAGARLLTRDFFLFYTVAYGFWGDHWAPWEWENQPQGPLLAQS